MGIWKKLLFTCFIIVQSRRSGLSAVKGVLIEKRIYVKFESKQSEIWAHKLINYDTIN